MFLLLFHLLVFLLPVCATTYSITASYLQGSCEDTPPYIVYAVQNGDCEEEWCVGGNSERRSVQCSTNYLPVIRDFFGSYEYILQELFSDDTCSTFEFALGFSVTDRCTGGDLTYNNHFKSWLYVDGSVRIHANCSSVNPVKGNHTVVQKHSCLFLPTNSFYDGFGPSFYDDMTYRWYSSNDNDDSGISTGATIGIICASIIVLLVIIGIIVIYRRRAMRNHGEHSTSVTSSHDAVLLESAISGQSGLWNDDIITAKRVPRDKIYIGKLLRRGAYGEVYAGRYNRRRVAVKMLIAANRSSLPHVTNFLCEAKMTATMDHPHIVTLIGVAWDSLSDLCIMFEFMDGGDLRTMLDKYEASKRPIGFNREKATIALHICHALTYLHHQLSTEI